MKNLFLFVSVLSCCYSAVAQDNYENAELKEQIKALDLAHARAIFE